MPPPPSTWAWTAGARRRAVGALRAAPQRTPTSFLAPSPVQVQLVMQYCDMGTLDAAIKDGTFQDADTGLPLAVRRAGRAGRAGLPATHRPATWCRLSPARRAPPAKSPRAPCRRPLGAAQLRPSPAPAAHCSRPRPAPLRPLQPQRCILLTALEMARGLQYLHHPDRRLVRLRRAAARRARPRCATPCCRDDGVRVRGPRQASSSAPAALLLVLLAAPPQPVGPTGPSATHKSEPCPPCVPHHRCTGTCPRTTCCCRPPPATSAASGPCWQTLVGVARACCRGTKGETNNGLDFSPNNENRK